MKKYQGFQSIENNISNLIKPIFFGSKREFIVVNALIKNWSEIVGKKYTKLCYPKQVKFDTTNDENNKSVKGKLTIAVYNSAVGFFLESNSELILERISSFYGYKSITKIIIKQEPKNIVATIDFTKKIDDESEKRIAKVTQNIADSNLAETLQKLGRAVVGKVKN